MNAPTDLRPPVAVVGAGSIGVAFALVFTRAGHAVRLFDPDADARRRADETFRARAADLSVAGLLDETPDLPASRLSLHASLAEAVADVTLVVECAPERVEVKQAIFAELDRLAPPDAVLASASSALPASRYTAGLAGRARCLVAHPGNPPYLIPVVEIVSTPFTEPAAADRAAALFAGAGMRPVRVGKEVEGFVFNRLQGALLREAYCLVRDGVASVEDIDTVVRDGLGPRWSLIGPFETVDLNTRGGIASHAQKMGPAYERMGAERGQHDPWTADLVEKVAGERRSALPLDQWEDRVAWRDRALMELVAHRRKSPSS
jgi:3-hydroxyacyl-CoA dehydrogenase